MPDERRRETDRERIEGIVSGYSWPDFWLALSVSGRTLACFLLLLSLCYYQPTEREIEHRRDRA